MTSWLLFLTLPALLMPPAAVHLPRLPAPCAARAALAPVMSNRLADGSDAGSSPAQPLALQPRRRWRQRAKKAGAVLATAALIALPRGPARAMPPSDGTPTAASMEASAACKAQHRAAQQEMAFLWFKKKKTLKPPLPSRPLRANEIDMNAIASKKAAKRYTERGYIFSDELTRRSELVDELEELDEVANERAFERTASTVSTYAVAAGGVYLTVKGLTGIERWMKKQELKDIEEERELTGQYISVDAGDVDTAIDPLTGKNLTIVKPKEASKPKGNATEGEAAPTPWILRVLGLDSAKAADDDDFWAPPTAATAPRKDPSSGGGGGSASGADGGEGGDGGEEGGDGTDDDTSDLDSVSDLLG